MEGLFMLQGHVRRAASGGFLRSQSNLVHSSSGLTFDCSECSDSECGGNGPSSRRIALAKRVLSEATRTFTPCLSISAQKADMCKNTGAIGPLMIMIQSESDNQALRCCLDTLSFLLLDKANRVVVQELSGLSLLMSLFLRETDWTLLRIVLDCVCSLVKNDDAEKEFVWSHAGKVGILGLMNAHASAPHLLEVLCHVRKIAFKGEGHSLVLLEPQLLLAASCILAKHHQPQAVVNKVCKFLRFCAQASCGPEYVDLWGLVLPLIVPLLRDPCSCEGALAVLLSLSEHAGLKHLFASVGIVPPVVFLMLHPTKAICVTASCVISALAEDAGPCRSQLSSEACLTHLLRALSATEQYPDVAVAVIYTLNKLVKQEPQSVSAILIQRGAPRLLMRLMPRWTDTELTMGAMQLIEAMGIDPEALFASSSSCSSTACTPQHSYSMGGPSLGLEISATSLQTSASSSLPIPSPMSVPAFDRTVSCNIEMTDALGMPLRKKAPSRQISSDSEGPSSSGMSFSTPMQQGRTDSGVEFSEAVSPVAGIRPSIWNTSATATAFLSLQSRPRVACLPDSEAVLPTAAMHTSHGESSAEASLYPSRSASPCAVRAKLALLPQPEPQGQQEASTRRVSNFTAGQIVLPAEPRSCVGVRSWSASCLLSLDGRILA